MSETTCLICFDQGYFLDAVTSNYKTCPCSEAPAPDNVVPIQQAQPHYAVAVFCVICLHRWLGLVVKETNIFQLECPSCKSQDSYACFLPQEYLEAHLR